MNLRSQVLSGLFWTGGGRLLSQLLSWGITLLVIRLLTPSDYGLLGMATVFTSFLMLMAELGLGPAVVQANDLDEARLRQVFGVVLLTNALLFVLLFFAAPLIAFFFGEDRLTSIVRVLALQFVAIAFAVLPNSLLERKLEFKKRSIVDVSGAIVSSLLTLALALMGTGVWALVLGNMVASVFRVIGLNIISPYLKWPRFSIRSMRSLILFGGNITASRLLWFLYSQADVVIVGKLLGKELLGYYSVSMHLASLPVQRISSIINQVAFPAFARIQNDPQMVSSHILKAFRLLSFITVPAFFGISSVAPELIKLLLGPRWNAAILPLQMLALIMPLRLLNGVLMTGADGVGRPDINVKNMAWATVMMPIAFLAGSNLGLFGLCLAWLVGYPAVSLFNLPSLLKVLNLRAFDLLRTLASPTLMSLCIYGAVLATRSYVTEGNVSSVALLTLVSAGALSYGALVLLFNRPVIQELKGLFK